MQSVLKESLYDRTSKGLQLRLVNLQQQTLHFARVLSATIHRLGVRQEYTHAPPLALAHHVSFDSIKLPRHGPWLCREWFVQCCRQYGCPASERNSKQRGRGHQRNHSAGTLGFQRTVPRNNCWLQAGFVCGGPIVRGLLFLQYQFRFNPVYYSDRWSV